MRFIKRKHTSLLYIIIFSFFLYNCQLSEPKKPHGVNFLENREKVLIVGKTNKNDVIKIIGNPHSTSLANGDVWIYFERTIVKGKLIKLGQNILKENNILQLKFDKYGILSKKKILNKEQMNKVNYSKRETKNNITKKSFVSKFLSSIKQKMYGSRKKN